MYYINNVLNLVSITLGSSSACRTCMYTSYMYIGNIFRMVMLILAVANAIQDFINNQHINETEIVRWQSISIV